MAATTLPHFLFLRLPGTALSELQGEPPHGVLRRVDVAEDLHICRAYVGNSVVELRRSFERLEARGELTLNSVQTLLSPHMDATAVRARLSPFELDEYLDLLPIAEDRTKIILLHTPERLSPQEAGLLKGLLTEGRPLFTAKDLLAEMEMARVVVLLLAPQLFGVAIDTPRATDLLASFAPAATRREPGSDTANRNVALLNTLSNDGERALASLHKLAPVSRVLEETIPGVRWPVKKTEELETSVTRDLSRPFRIAFYGRFSAGKSSLINALLHSYLLPVSDQPTTATVHSISFGEGANMSTTVVFKSEWEVAQDIDDILRTCGFGGREEEVGDLTAARRRLAEIASNLSSFAFLADDQRRMIRDTWAALEQALPAWGHCLGSTIQWDERQLSDVIRGSGPTFLVLNVNTRRNLPILAAGMQLVDLPGVDSMTPSHARIADREIKEADAVVYTMAAQQAFSTFDHDRLRRLYEQRDPATVVLCASRIDQVGDPDGIVQGIITQHGKAFPSLPAPKVVPISGLFGMCARLAIKGSLKDLADQIFSEYRKSIKSAKGLSHYDRLELSNILELESEIGILAESRRGIAIAASVAASLNAHQTAVENECDLLLNSWDLALKQTQTQVSRAQATRARLLELAERSKARFTQMASAAADKAKAQLQVFSSTHAAQMAQEYLCEYHEIRKLIGTHGALAFLDEDILAGIRRIFERGIGAQQEEVLDRLQQELDDLRVQAADLARSIEADSFVALTGTAAANALGGVPSSPLALEEEALRFSRTLTDAMLLALDPTGSFGAKLLRQKTDQMALEFAKQSLDIISHNIERTCKNMGDLAVSTIQERISEAEARLSGFLTQARVLNHSHSAWKDALHEYVGVISSVAMEVKDILSSKQLGKGETERA